VDKKVDKILAKSNLLTSAFLKSAPTGKHIDGAGLWFIKRPDGGAQWMLRISLGGKRREMGLGGFPDVALKEARELAADYRKRLSRNTPSTLLNVVESLVIVPLKISQNHIPV